MGEEQSQASIYFKSTGVVAGIPFAQAIFDVSGCSVTWYYEEGEELIPDSATTANKTNKLVLGTVTGRACDLLLAERTVLNVMSRACGVATQVEFYVVYMYMLCHAIIMTVSDGVSVFDELLHDVCQKTDSTVLYSLSPLLYSRHGGWQSSRRPVAGRVGWLARGRPPLASAWWRSTPSWWEAQRRIDTTCPR